MNSDLIFRSFFPLRHFQHAKSAKWCESFRLTFCDKIVILLNGLLMKSLVDRIHFSHLTWTVKVPMRQHYWVDKHWIVLLLHAVDGRWHFIFRRAFRAVSLIVTLIDDLHGRIRCYCLAVDWMMKLNSIPIGYKRKRERERGRKIKNESEDKLEIHPTWKPSTKGNWKF